jgi:hypothetical protein
MVLHCSFFTEQHLSAISWHFLSEFVQLSVFCSQRYSRESFLQQHVSNPLQSEPQKLQPTSFPPQPPSAHLKDVYLVWPVLHSFGEMQEPLQVKIELPGPIVVKPRLSHTLVLQLVRFMYEYEQ